MNEVERLVASIVRSGVPLERESVAAAASMLRPVEAPLTDDSVVQDVADAIVGLGPLEELLRDPQVSDVLVNGPDQVWVEREGVLSLTQVTFRSADAIVAAVRRAIAPLGLRLDWAVPAVDARLPDGSRLHAIIPPASVDGPLIAIRRFVAAFGTLDDLVAAGSVTDDGAELLREAVANRSNIVVCGGTGSGKTTLLNLLAAQIDAAERIVTIEDAAELHVAGHVVRLEAHPPNVEGSGEITIRSLLAHALRLRPDRIIVGEVRGDEAADMIQALNTGHDGSMSTIHANGPQAALGRLEVLATRLSGTGGASTVRAQIDSAIDLVVHVGRRGGKRVVRSVHVLSDQELSAVYSC
jgi:pilus assembly protein CpaF